MSTKIEWTDETWNPTTGCTKISPGCAHCYIERTPPFRIAGRKFVGGKIPLQLHEDRLETPLHWRKPRLVFVNSLSDLFHEDVPDSFIDRVFAVMALCPQHVFQVLTKRAERMEAYFLDLCYRTEQVGISAEGLGGLDRYVSDEPRWPLPLSNCWLGVSVEDRKHGLPRIAHLLRTPAAVRFLSVEPLIEKVDLSPFLFSSGPDGEPAPRNEDSLPCLHWVIVGGESGPGSRPFDVSWARSIITQCKDAGVPCFVKQLGSNVVWCGGQFPTDYWPLGTNARGNHYAVERVILKNKKGGDPSEWPEDLRVREMPERKAVLA